MNGVRRLAVAQGFHGALLGEAGGALARCPRWRWCRSRRSCRPTAAGSWPHARPAGRSRTACPRPPPGAPNHSPLMCVNNGRCTLLPRQASPSSSGVTNTGDSAERGLDCRKPKPLASSAGIRLRSDTSLTSPISWIWRGRLLRRDRHRHVVGDDHDLRFQVDAVVLADHAHRIARAEEAGTGGLVHQRIGVEAFRHFGAARAAHALHVRKIGAAVDEFVGARQRRGQSAEVQVEHAVGVCPRSAIRTGLRVAAPGWTSPPARAAGSARCRWRGPRASDHARPRSGCRRGRLPSKNPASSESPCNACADRRVWFQL